MVAKIQRDVIARGVFTSVADLDNEPASISCCAGNLALHRLASISPIIRRPKRSTSALMIWRPYDELARTKDTGNDKQ